QNAAMGRKSREKATTANGPKPPPVGKTRSRGGAVATPLTHPGGSTRRGARDRTRRRPQPQRPRRFATAAATEPPRQPEGRAVGRANRPGGRPDSGRPAACIAGSVAPGATADGIECQTREQVAYRIHAHLTVFVDGQTRQVPYGIGIARLR